MEYAEILNKYIEDLQKELADLQDKTLKSGVEYPEQAWRKRHLQSALAENRAKMRQYNESK